MRRRYRVAGMLLATGLAVAVVRTYIWSGNTAVTTPVISSNVQGAATNDFATKQVTNSYFSAQFPTRFSQKRSSDGQGTPVYLQQLFTATSDANLYSDQLAVTVGKTLPEGIKDVSDVKLRSITSSYNQLFFAWLPDQDAVSYEKTEQGYELGVFIGHGTYYVEIVESGIIANKERMIHEMQLLVSSLAWH
jgi:hypothetical protein